jgi:L-ascorbate metabolism protein UlaG (beta-lactamase superfamily)
MKFRLLRHATSVVELGKIRLLVDPMLSPKGTMAPVERSPKMRPNPLTDLPVNGGELHELLHGIHGVLVTHMHRDHFDAEAARIIPKGLPLFCQPGDAEKLEGLGFTAVQPVDEGLKWEGVRIIRTGGQHGSAAMAPGLGPVSGFVLEAGDEPGVYIAGDTVWCPEVRQALDVYRPGIAVVNAGAARFLSGGRITMSVSDIGRIARQFPGTKIIAVHMEAFNHCLLTRESLRAFIGAKNLSARVFVPEDGEEMAF